MCEESDGTQETPQVRPENVDRCLVAPSPELRERIKNELSAVIAGAGETLRRRLASRQPRPVGMCDGVIYPGDYFPLGTSAATVRSAAADRAPLSGQVRVVVVLAQFSDRAMTASLQHFEELFFSTGVLANGSVKEYFAEVTHGSVDIVGEVVGPYQLPLTHAEYAHGDSGTGMALPNARTMARDAATAADPDVDFGPYDNDGDGFVDAFIVIHAGPGAEQTGSAGDIWSHKWVLAGGQLDVDSTKIYGYLTVPEDARIGVCCHELGHLLFGFPDLYDTDGTSEGIGNWCLMAGGSWNGGGDIPAHPSAWCKVNQGWVSVVTPTTNASSVSIPDVKSSHSILRLWKDGLPGSEYFLVENRQRTLYDAHLPGDGLLIWHVDEAIAGNTAEAHPKVALEQADGNDDLGQGTNRGDAGDSWPGSGGKTTFDGNSTPGSKSYGNMDTCVALRNISPSAAVMTADVSVKCFTKSAVKEIKDTKDRKKETKERKEYFKERKEYLKERKEFKEWEKRPEKPEIDKSAAYDKGFDEKFTDGGFDYPGDLRSSGELDVRVSQLERRLAELEPFIGGELRPDLRQSALAGEEDVKRLQKEMRRGAASAKRSFDTKSRDA